MYALMQGRGACASRLFVLRIKRAALLFVRDLQLLTSLYVAQFIVWRTLRREGEKRPV
jgi:hypothetical protein